MGAVGRYGLVVAALEEALDLEDLGRAEKVLEIVLRHGHFARVDEPGKIENNVCC